FHYHSSSSQNRRCSLFIIFNKLEKKIEISMVIECHFFQKKQWFFIKLLIDCHAFAVNFFHQRVGDKRYFQSRKGLYPANRVKELFTNPAQYGAMRIEFFFINFLNRY